MHCRQANYHLKRSVLQHLVAWLFQYSRKTFILTWLNSAPSAAPVYPNGTTPAATTPAVVKPTTAVGTTSVKASASATPSTISASSGNKAFALSGASLAGLLGLAAYVL